MIARENQENTGGIAQNAEAGFLRKNSLTNTITTYTGRTQKEEELPLI